MFPILLHTPLTYTNLVRKLNDALPACFSRRCCEIMQISQEMPADQFLTILEMAEELFTLYNRGPRGILEFLEDSIGNNTVNFN